MHPLVSCCSLLLVGHRVQAAVNCMCPLYVCSCLACPEQGGLADLPSRWALPGSPWLLRAGCVLPLLQAALPLVMPGGQANSSSVDNYLSPLKGHWENFLDSFTSCWYQRQILLSVNKVLDLANKSHSFYKYCFKNKQHFLC